MASFIFLIILLLGLMAGVVFLWWRQRAYLKKKTSEAMSEPVWEEIVQEREAALEKRRKFKQAIDEAAKKTVT
ncbi:MAG: hypothetical protein Q8P84_02040 [Deltaproteobacteria bacterium]|nr:hypothetical protein [Deltaproteobacteria bacterium]